MKEEYKIGTSKNMNKIKNLYLWTTPDNKVALKFYEKMGMRTKERQMEYILVEK